MISLIDVKYDHGYKEKLLDGLSFEIKKGEIVAIVGGNGCGKSTLLKLINGEDSPDSGTIAISQDMKVMAKLEQIPERLEDNITVQDVIMPDVYNAQQELEAASLEFANPDANMKKVEERYNRALNHLEEVSNNIAHKISTAKQNMPALPARRNSALSSNSLRYLCLSFFTVSTTEYYSAATQQMNRSSPDSA